MEHFYADCPVILISPGGNGGSGIPSAISSASFRPGGNGGKGIPSATNNVLFSPGGSGGSGIPSAINRVFFTEGGSGGNGMPSATSICLVPIVVLIRLTDDLDGITMNPASNERPESRATFLKRKDDTSRCHPWRYLVKTIFRLKKVPITEQIGCEEWMIKFSETELCCATLLRPPSPPSPTCLVDWSISLLFAISLPATMNMQDFRHYTLRKRSRNRWSAVTTKYFRKFWKRHSLYRRRI